MKAGERYIITTGEYSDYGIRDSFVVLKTFSFDAALETWISKNGDDGSFSFETGKDEQSFLAWLRSEGYVADETMREVHLADYSRPNTTPAKDRGDEPAQECASTPHAAV
jgi:hypothetical protein